MKATQLRSHLLTRLETAKQSHTVFVNYFKWGLKQSQNFSFSSKTMEIAISCDQGFDNGRKTHLADPY